MRNSNFTLQACLLAVALAACSEPQAPAVRPVEPKPAPPRRIASFEALITPPSRGPGMGQMRGTAVFTLIPEGSDGVLGTNPPRTIQIRSLPGGFVVGGNVGACPSGSISVPVEITNFLPERLVDLHIAFTNITGSEHQLCEPGSQPLATPGPGGFPVFDPPPANQGPFGYLNYVVPDVYPRNSLAGSLVDTGAAAGATTLPLDWSFGYPGVSTPYTIRGEVWADPYPNAPRIGGDSWFGHVEGGEDLGWFVYDTKDDQSAVVVPRTRVQICDQAFAADGTCASGHELLGPGGALVNANAHQPTFSTYGAGAPDTLVPGSPYFFRAVNVWTPTGAVTPVTGTWALIEPFVATGHPALLTPTAGQEVADGFTFSWSTVSPGISDPFFFGEAVYQICANASCAAVLGQGFLGVTSTETPVGSGTFTYSVAPNLISLTPGVTYYWRVRNLFPGRAGPFTGTRAFVYSTTAQPTPTHVGPADGAFMVQGNPNLADDVLAWAATSGATATEVQICADALCNTALYGPAAGSGPGPAYSLDPYSVFTPVGGTTYYWQVRNSSPLGPWLVKVNGDAYAFRAAGPPFLPTNLLPVDGSPGPTTTLTWTLTSGADSSRVTVCAFFSSCIFVASGMDNAPVTCPGGACSFDVTPLPAGTYFWKVRNVYLGESGLETDPATQSFTR